MQTHSHGRARQRKINEMRTKFGVDSLVAEKKLDLVAPKKSSRKIFAKCVKSHEEKR